MFSLIIPPQCWHFGFNVGTSISLSVNYLLPTKRGFVADYNRCARDLLDYAQQVLSAPLEGSTQATAIVRATKTLEMFRRLFHSCGVHCCLFFFREGARFADAIDAFLDTPRNQRAPPKPIVELTAEALQAAHAEWLRQTPREDATDGLPRCECDGKPKRTPASKRAQTKLDPARNGLRSSQRGQQEPSTGTLVHHDKEKREAMQDDAEPLGDDDTGQEQKADVEESAGADRDRTSDATRAHSHSTTRAATNSDDAMHDEDPPPHHAAGHAAAASRLRRSGRQQS